MVAYLTKSDASEGFNQVINFLNGSYIKYDLTVNLNIYVSCIKQFWNIVTIKQDNDVTRMQALVDKKKVVVTEAVIRNVLWLDDAEGVDCLPNEEILQSWHAWSMSAKRTSWNEFSLAMASAVICLSTGDDTAAHGEVPTVSQEPSIPSPTPPTPLPQPPQALPSTSHGRIIDEMDKDDAVALMDDKEEDKKDEEAKVVENDQVQGRQAESQAKIFKINMDHASKVLSMQEDEPAEVQEVVDVVTTAKLITEVVTFASTIISAAEPQVPAATINAALVKVAAAPSRRRKGVVIKDPEKESTTSSIIPAQYNYFCCRAAKYARKLHDELNKDIDWDAAIDHVKLKAKEDLAIQRYQAMKRKPQTEAQARKNMMMYLKNVTSFRLDYFKGISYDDIQEESRALQRINKTPAKRAAKRRKLDEEVKDLKRHLEIVPDEDDDVYTEATPLARKVPVVDNEIIEINNKPYYKIIQADETHQLYICFLTLLKNFDREDLEAL
nr:hypothetical protein [Tanacetum cinerariifolium]